MEIEDDITWPAAVALDLEDAVYATQQLLDNEGLWVHRRVERIEFLDKGQVRRQMSVDYTLPRLDGERPIPYVPISVVKKHVLKAFDVRDESDTSLPVLTRQQNAPIAAAFLVVIAKLRLQAHGLALPEVVEQDLRTIAGAPPLNTDDAVDDTPVLSVSQAEFDSAYRRLREPTTTAGTKLWEDEDYAQPWIIELAEQFILFVDTDTTPLRRRVIKFRYEQALQKQVRGWKIMRPFTWMWGRGRDSLQSIGLLAYNAAVPAQAIVDCESYHAEVLAPEELFITSAALKTRAWGAGPSDWVTVSKDVCVDRASLYAANVTEQSVETSIIDVNFRLKPGGLLVASFLCSLFTTALLWAGWYLHRDGVVASHDPLTALLLALPAIYGVFLVPGREHLLTRRMFKGLRFFVLITAVIAFVAAAGLALDFHGARQVDVWTVHFTPSTPAIWLNLGRISGGISAVLFASLASSWLAHMRPWPLKKTGVTSDGGVH